MAGTPIVPVVDEGLGNSAHLVDLGDGRALTVDAPRDLRAARAAAAASGLERAGHPGTPVLTGGPPDWARATGRGLE